MVWTGISLGYSTDLHIFKRGSVMAVRYGDEVLEPIVRLYAAAVGPTFVLMDDNAHPHRADIVDDYLKSEGIARIAWPAYSLDLLSIENLWDALGRAVSSRFPPPATLIELETALQEEWRLLNSAVVDHLIESIVRSTFNLKEKWNFSEQLASQSEASFSSMITKTVVQHLSPNMGWRGAARAHMRSNSSVGTETHRAGNSLPSKSVLR
ncbi:transposable element Tcb1 transposase [Trichonephila clavipes]|nr:transposable element Tcb1 transposase [Trichonephila clavipes]